MHRCALTATLLWTAALAATHDEGLRLPCPFDETLVTVQGETLQLPVPAQDLRVLGVEAAAEQPR